MDCAPPAIRREAFESVSRGSAARRGSRYFQRQAVRADVNGQDRRGELRSSVRLNDTARGNPRERARNDRFATHCLGIVAGKPVWIRSRVGRVRSFSLMAGRRELGGRSLVRARNVPSREGQVEKQYAESEPG